MFDLNQLRCFVAVAEELHFGRAAARLNMTQPPLSRQVQILERILDVALFERTSRSVRLTPAGQSFLAEARRILKQAEGAALLARRVAAGQAGAIGIGFTATSAYSFLPDLVSACRRQLPDVTLVLREMVSGDQVESLASGQIDAGLLRPPVVQGGTASFRVAEERLMAAVPADHPLAAAPRLSLRDFAAAPFIMYAPHEARYFHDLVIELFARSGLLPDYVQHLSQIHSILALVRSGLGLSIVPEAALQLQIRGVVLRPLDLAAPRSAELYIAWRQDNDNPLLPLVLDIARGLAEQHRLNDAQNASIDPAIGLERN
ncbi:LysR family transcriptional regulator [Inquilinus limosus]|uniref:LysR substrate-binding domain-containing protein n=1 Tax=Inquilinus limosus TaxID=171674 RepID=UPI00068D4E0F|nr:LysR substrate-binding domain-containing protein [Inquilinus limosus]